MKKVQHLDTIVIVAISLIVISIGSISYGTFVEQSFADLGKTGGMFSVIYSDVAMLRYENCFMHLPPTVVSFVQATTVCIGH